jgi:hypothetical protein
VPEERLHLAERTRPQVGGRHPLHRSTGTRRRPASGIPDPLVEAVRKLATELYENREAASLGNSVNEPLPYGLEEMIAEFLDVEVG